MKASFFKSALLTIGAIAILASCNLLKKDDVFASLSAASTSFVNGKANVVVSLSAVSGSNVEVSLSCTGNIPSEAISFNNPVEVPAGSISTDVSVFVDTDKLSPGQYEATISIASVKGAKVDPSQNTCTISLSVQEPAVVRPVVSISNYSEAFADGKASFTLSMDKATEADVIVNFTVVTEADGFAAIPASALTFDNPAIIPAGSVSKAVNVTLDQSAIQKGVSNYAVIAISSVSDNADVSASKTKTYIEATAPLTANLRNDWTLTFESGYVHDGDTYDVINVGGVGENGTYYIFIYELGTIDHYFSGDMTKFVETMEGIVSEALTSEYPYQIKTGVNGWLYKPFSIGEYEMWLLGCTESGHLTGDYAAGSFKVEASAAQLEAYNKWIGEWNVTRSSVTDKWVISEKIAGASFYITGIDGVVDYPVEADFDAANDCIYLYAQNCGELAYNGVTYVMYLCGVISYAGQLYPVTPSGSGFDVAVVRKSGENAATIESAGSVSVSGIGDLDVVGMCYYADDPNSDNGLIFNRSNFYMWPEKMTQVVYDENDPVYKSFLGKWNIKRMDSEWDSSASAYKQLGEVTDTWTIEPKLAGSSYTITGFEGFTDVSIVANYNPTSGTFTVSEQSFTIGEYNLATLGLFYYSGNAQYPAGNYLWDEGAVVFSGKISGDTITLTPAQAGSYGDFIMFQLFNIQSDGAFTYHEVGYALPNTLTKAQASSAAPRAPMRAGNKAQYKLSKGGSQKQPVSFHAHGCYRSAYKPERHLPVKK